MTRPEATLDLGAETPAALGYAMPPEWAPHERTLMAWPCRVELWPDGLEAARKAYARVAATIAEFEPVTLLCNAGDAVEAKLMCGRGVEVLTLPIDDSWVRDNGPTYLVHRETGARAAVQWRFNGYGGKVDWPHDNDARVPERYLDQRGERRFVAPMVLEGGALHVDGAGTVLVTEQCLLNPNRNPSLSKAEIEATLRAYLGVDTVLWLPEGLIDDDTDGHVDEIACFARPGTVLALTTQDQDDPQYPILHRNAQLLRGMTDAAGRPLEVVELPQPRARRVPDGRRQSLSYVNFYLCNGGVILPSFEDPCDDRARRILAEQFPDRDVVQVPGLPISLGGGCVHCITQQVPVEGAGVDGAG